MAVTAISVGSTTTLAAESESGPAFVKKPMVIGLYGLPGSGKSTLLNQVKLALDHRKFDFYEGSEVISANVIGGLTAFAKLDEQEKRFVRERAITSVAEACLARSRAAFVAGHCMFWAEDEVEGKVVATASDFRVFTQIIYLEVPAPVILEHRLGDTHRQRKSTSAAHLERWQRVEIDHLRGLCRDHGILFSTVPQHSDPLQYILKLVRCFEQTNASCASNLAIAKVKAALPGKELAETVLVVDADKTLAGEDAGSMYWHAVHGSKQLLSYVCPLETLFSGPLGYSESAFRQATLLYEESANEGNFEILCEKIATSITIHPEFRTLLQLVCSHGHIRVIVLTCGIRRVWQLVIDQAGLTENIEVVGGGRIVDEIVITPEIKAQVVTTLQKEAGLYVWAFGDSPLDLPMLEVADRSIIVSGDIRTRSRSMENALRDAIEKRGLCAQQVLLPPHAVPRLDTEKLPLLAFSDRHFLEAILCRRSAHVFATVLESARTKSNLVHATDMNAAKLLMSPTRDASIAGVALRKAHKEVGKFLAVNFLTERIGIEEFDVPHVQGHQTTGFRLANESRTTIIALMRGGEPMAFGVNEVFPRAMFLHASCSEDIKDHHLTNQKNVILVDSVVNSGKSMMEFLRHVFRLKKDLANIVVLAGVVQEEAVASGHALREMMEQHQITIVALRVSSNKFTGSKNSDTGNRLFNTTHLA
ncbi:hypothetical protein PWT90_06761 [Aphanocladium album]|nr:hypothetical protein PWT90_06761 [Aphanocladium album]